MEINKFYLIFANLLDYPSEDRVKLFNDFLSIVNNTFSGQLPSIDTLELEYTKLFINAHPFVPAPPFASVYLPSENIYDIVENFYKRGNYLIDDRKFPPDYLIYELVFLFNLFNDKNYRLEGEFLNSHFIPWFQKFSIKVKENDETGFYSFITEKIEIFLKNRLKELENGKTDIPTRIF